MRLLAALLVVALSATLLAGCVSQGEPEPAPEAPRDDAPAAPAPSEPPAAAPPTATNPAPVQDAGDISGPFQKAWDFHVPRVGFREAQVDFALAGAQPGAPPTARIQFSLLDPEGKVVKTALVGLGGEGDKVSWTLGAADLPTPGTYTLHAVSGADAQPGSLAAPGLAKYTLHAEVLY